MTRSLPHRLAALVAAALFLFSWGGEALGQHGCPHHSGVPGRAAHAEDVSSGHAAHHPAESTAQAGRDGPVPAPADSHQACTCQGTCPSAAGVALPAVAKDAVPLAVRQGRAPLGSAPQIAASRWIPFFLPYGQAPPTVG